MEVWRETLILYTLVLCLIHPMVVICSHADVLEGQQLDSEPGTTQTEIERSLMKASFESVSRSLKKVLSEIEASSLEKIINQVDAGSKSGSISGDLFDISWMSTSDKRIFQNFITWYKMILVNLNALNPRTWNLDFVVPAVGSVVSLYTGPILALILILFLFFTVPTFAQSIIGGGRNLKMFPSVSQFLNEVGTRVDDALQRHNVLYED